MVDIPAVCSSCGALFVAPNLFGGSGTVEFHNSRISRCPACGGVGDIFDGVYDAATNTARLLISAVTKQHQLRKLEEIFVAARKNNLSRDEIDEKVQDEVPELKSIKDWLPKTRTELYAFVGIVLALITYVTSTTWNLAKAGDGVSKDQIEELIVRVIHEQINAPNPPPTQKRK